MTPTLTPSDLDELLRQYGKDGPPPGPGLYVAHTRDGEALIVHAYAVGGSLYADGTDAVGRPARSFTRHAPIHGIRCET